ncbi:nucleolar complex-associated protein-domain-containing protein [Pilobolus umbonatus]|nr:nucleolar complex-associated protein-domain-containing protein [Pilobolus umbonatus]
MPPKKTARKPGQKNGVNKKTNTKGTSAKGTPTKGAPTKGAPAKGAKPQKKKEQKRSIPEYVDVPTHDDEDVKISQDDLEFFNYNHSFLTELDSKALSRNTAKDKKKKKNAAKKVVQKANRDESSEDDLDNFEEMDQSEILANLDMEDEVDSEMEEDEEEGFKEEEEKFGDSDEEMDYEMKPRKVAKAWTAKDYHTKLPIKLPSGKFTQAEEAPVVEEKDSDDEDENTEDVVSENKEEVEEVEEPKISKKQYIMNKKEELALIASNLQGDPEEFIGQLRTLRSIYKEDNPIVKKLAILTQLAVYKDIIPGYRIRPLTAAEESVQVSKDVKKVREFEKSLLSNYEAYLKDLNTLLTKKNAEVDPSMALIAARCLCELLTSKTHFNFRLEIMASVVTHMSSVQWDEIAELCRKALIEVFENDESGRYSLDAVKMITRMIRSKGYVVSENAISTFLHLRLRDEMASRRSGNEDDDKVGKKRKSKSKAFLTKKARKTLKETKEIEKEFQEAEAVVSKEEKDRNHTETLKLLFAFYFRILKKQTSSPLLPAVLEGLSKFAHLISVDFFDDLLNALRDVMRSFADSDDISRTSSGTRKRLLCIITAFELLSGQGESLNYDLKDFYAEIYSILLKSTFHTKIEEKPPSQLETESDMIMKALELMFLKKRQIPINRLASFIKRFAMVALNMPDKTALQCLALINRLFHKDNRLDALLQSEDRTSDGVYLPLLDDPELCNPFGASLYELFLYQNHYNPNIRKLSKSIQVLNNTSK